jgi:integrase
MIDKEIFLLKRVLTWSQKFGKIPRTIFIEDWEPNKKEQEETKILSKDEYMTIVNYMKVDNPYYGLCVRFLNNSGVRYPSELNGIKWGDIDFKRRTLSIEGRKRGNKRTRVDTFIPITDRTRDILLELRNRPKISCDDDDYVFVNNKGKRIRSFNRYWKTTLKHLEIDTDYTLYSLRHLFTTRLLQRPDISIKLISEMLGHSDTTMVQRVYGKWINIDKKVDTMLKSEEERELELKRLNESP